MLLVRQENEGRKDVRRHYAVLAIFWAAVTLALLPALYSLAAHRNAGSNHHVRLSPTEVLLQLYSSLIVICGLSALTCGCLAKLRLNLEPRQAWRLPALFVGTWLVLAAKTLIAIALAASLGRSEPWAGGVSDFLSFVLWAGLVVLSALKPKEFLAFLGLRFERPDCL